MEGILRGEEISAVIPFDYGQRILFFPVRHHSPACSFHLKKAIESYAPQCILVEGPENANGLIPVFVNKDTKAPFAVYYSYKDSLGLVGEEKEEYKCYYPFLDCSPELVALRTAEALKIPAAFIDLPYSEILIHTSDGHGMLKKEEKNNYNDDYLLSRSRYLTMLCEKTGLRDFDEFWEKYFEIGGLYKTTEEFVRQMLVYCCLSRENSPKEELEAEGCLVREQYMSERILKAAQKYERVLVVTGGFHTQGLYERTTAAQKEDPLPLHKLDEKDQGIYPMAYSMEAADALNGYASGMQAPGFYHSVWRLCTEREVSAGSVRGAYEEAVLELLVAKGKKVRRKNGSLSSYDEIIALSMAKGLAALRDKREPGLYELKDSVLSAFVKGECNASTGEPLAFLQEAVTGDAVGQLCAGAQVPPLVQDFERQCRTFGLKIHTALEQETVLEIFASDRHRRMSEFFYQMQFLDTGFAKKVRGPDLLTKKDRSLIRETWKYKWSSQVVAVLIDHSVSGGVLPEACMNLLGRRMEEAQGLEEAAGLLVSCFLMGLEDRTGRLMDKVAQLVTQDGDFFSLVYGFGHLNTLLELEDLYKETGHLKLETMTRDVFRKIVQLLPAMAAIKDEQQTDCMKACTALYQTAGRKSFRSEQGILIAAFEQLLEDPQIHPGLEGTVLGLLYGYDASWQKQVEHVFSGYIRGTREKLMEAAKFLRGLFYTARDLVLVGDSFVKMTDELLKLLDTEEFMAMLPELRMAFGYFTPMETDRIAAKAAGLHGSTGKDLMKGPEIPPALYEYGERLDRWAASKLKEQGYAG